MKAFILTYWVFLVCFFSWVRDWGQEEGKQEGDEYLGPQVLRPTEIQRSLVVSLDPESVIICLWGHKEPTEPCSGKQRNTEKEVRAAKPSITDPTTEPLDFVCLYVNEEETLDSYACDWPEPSGGISSCDACRAQYLSPSLQTGTTPQAACIVFGKRCCSHSIGSPGGLAEITYQTWPVQGLAHG